MFGDTLLCPLLGFDFFPALLDLSLVELGRVQRGIELTGREHVRMATDQLAGDAVDDPGKLEATLFTGQLAVVDHLEQQIAQLTLQVLEIAALDGVGHFVGFFEGVGDDACVGLLEVPRATVLRVTQAGHEVEQVV
ncbi:hypothetical protein D3C78_1104270 [compost metagenome]